MVAARRRGAGRAGCALAAAQPALTLAGHARRSSPPGCCRRRPLALGAPRTTRPRGWRLLAVAPCCRSPGVLVALAAAGGQPGRRRGARAGRPPCPPTVAGARRRPDPAEPPAAARGRCPARSRRSRCSSPPAWWSPRCWWSGRTRRLVDARPAASSWPGLAVLATSADHGRRPDAARRHRARPPAVARAAAGGGLLTARPGPRRTSALSPGRAARACGTPAVLVAAGCCPGARRPGRRPRPRAADRRRGPARDRRLGAGSAQLPAAPRLLVALRVAVGGVALTGGRPASARSPGCCCCVVLTAVHRWLSRPRGSSGWQPAAPQRGLLPLAGPVQQRRGASSSTTTCASPGPRPALDAPWATPPGADRPAAARRRCTPRTPPPWPPRCRRTGGRRASTPGAAC